MSCLVVLELENGKPNRPSLATISAAKKLAKDIDVLILDDGAKEEVEKLTDASVTELPSISAFNLFPSVVSCEESVIPKCVRSI